MEFVFKQTFNSFNLEFDDYLEVLFQLNDEDFRTELQNFGRELFRYVLKVRSQHAVLRDLREELLAQTAHGAVLIAGRLVLLTAILLQPSITARLTDDFPKFIGSKTNYWRYLLRFIPVYLDEVYLDYTKQFAVATACILELNVFCLQLGQHDLVENFRMFWTAMFLHFFGERFRDRDKCAFLNDLDLENKGQMEPKALQAFVKVEVPKAAADDKSKKMKIKYKKRRK